jgi:hypothetical protein
MIQTDSGQPPKKDSLSSFEIGTLSCSVLAVIGVCCLAAVFGLWLARDRFPAVGRLIPTPTMTPTPQPHILVHIPKHGEKIVTDDFGQESLSRWKAEGNVTRTKISNGKMNLWSTSDDYIGVTWCTTCGTFRNRYYVQADLGANVDGELIYALMFDFMIDNQGWRFYALVLKPNKQEYALQEYADDKWNERLKGRSDTIHEYPDWNTLSVYVNGNLMELYANGELLDTYTARENLPGGFVGFITFNENLSLVVDNLFVYQSASPQATFTPLHPQNPTRTPTPKPATPTP